MPFTAARVDIALDGANADVTHAQLHVGDPGVDGTANVATQTPRVPITLPASAAGSSADTVTFTIAGAEGPYTHVSLWNALTVGTFQGSGALSPQETFAGPGELEVTVTTTAAST